MGNTPAFEVVFEAGQGMFEIFHAHTSIDVLALQLQVDIGVGEKVFRFLSPYLLVVLRQQHIALHRSVKRDTLLLFLSIYSQTAICDQQ